MIKKLIGGSPCTRWSIAQTKNRETEPKGVGWELFENYEIALEKFRPDFFLYENNKSMSPAIRERITAELGVEPILINSALVSAQSRQRLYWVGQRNPDGSYSQVPVQQPEDRGILLRDILESGMAWTENGYTLKAQYYKSNGANCVSGHYVAPMVAEPVRIGAIESAAKNADFDSQQYRVYSPDGKSVTLCGQGGGIGAKTGLYAVPVSPDRVGTMPNEKGELKNSQSRRIYSIDGKAPSICASQSGVNCDISSPSTRLYAIPCNCTKPVRVCNIDGGGQGNRIYSTDAKSCAIKAQGGGLGGHGQGLYAIPADGKTYPVYEVRDGQITIKDKQYPIKLMDGFYIIRKLTVRECMRLQTVPEDYIFPVSNTQAYKMLGNGWTVDVIAHILSYCPGITEEPLEVLSMYDGMSCGRLALNKLGAHIAHYYATEIDKYAVQTTQRNFPDTIQLGDAFQVRDEAWKL